MDEDIQSSFNRVLGDKGKYFDIDLFSENILMPDIDRTEDIYMKNLLIQEYNFLWFNFNTCKSLIDFHLKRYVNPPKVNFAYLDNYKLGAVAGKGSKNKEFYIGMYFGSAHVMRSLFNKLLCSPNVLPWIGNISMEQSIKFGNPFEITMLMTKDFLDDNPDIRVAPNDPTRRDAARVLTNLAMQFLLMHELGHIVLGHLYLISSENEANKLLIDTVDNDMAKNKQSNLPSQAMELEADWFASFHCLKTSYQLENVKEITKDSARAIELCVFAITCVFRVMSLKSYDAKYLDNYDHPPLGIRIVMLLDGIGDTLEKNHLNIPNKKFSFQEIKDLLYTVTGDIEKGIIDSCDEPEILRDASKNYISSMSEEDHIQRLKDYLDEVMPVRSKPFKLAFVNP